ncbi:MAG: Sec-dependent nitrous-oxide reductase [Balneolaceae bacterium]|nr:Sec-dependent nitrous-oxide reductase [Balneolaceae bacterium]MCH8547850.1 Sec-dependent nitrous-oxide reductase [Balneolaceae bacterium]
MSKSKKNKLRGLLLGAGFVAIAAFIFTGCPSQQGMMDRGDAAQKVYVAPGDHDEYYGFFSGGYSGQLSVWGLPSARFLKVIPVFSQDPETGYGYSEETKPLLQTSYGFIPWDDSHHPHISQTDGDADGRWIFINGNNTPRIARIDLQTFETKEILELPNTGGNHASSFVTSNTEYVIGATRFSIPYEMDLDVPIDSYSDEFRGALSFIEVDPESGRMEMDFQILVPPYNYDLGRAGKGQSSDWVFFTTYNTEEAHTMLEINASRNDKDYIAAVNWKRAAELVREGRGTTMDAYYYHNYYEGNQGIAINDVKDQVTVLTPEDGQDFIYFLPTPKSPHGVDIDPTGEYIVAGGKLATVIPVHSFSRMLEAIENRDFDGNVENIPILNYDTTIAGEVQDPGLGPLHTEFDSRGYAYTSVYISSEIVKWSLDTFEVVDRIDAYYSIGHLMITGGDTKNPDDLYLVGLTKTAKDRYLPTGPKQNHPAQLYDISGDRMELLLDFPTIGEPHYAQAIRADKISGNVAQIYEIEDNDHPYAIDRINQNRVERDGDVVRVYMGSTRSHFRPDNIEGIKVGDTVYFHLTNLEQEWDVVHGIAIKGANNSEILVAPGQTKTMKWEPKRTGIYPFYCTAFCSALHQEMQGYVRVSAADSDVELTWKTGTN